MTNRINPKSIIIMVALATLITAGLVYAITIQRSVTGSAVLGQVQTVEQTVRLWTSAARTTELGQVSFGTLDINAFGRVRTLPRIPVWVENGADVPFALTVEATSVRVTAPGTSAQVMNDALRILFGPAGGQLKPAPDHAIIVNPGTGNMVAGELSLQFLKPAAQLGPTGTQLAFDILFKARDIGVEATVYSNDFAGAAGPEWSNTSIDTTPAGARRFLGQFGNGTVSLTLANLPAHTQATVSFDLFIIRTWDGNNTLNVATAGPDVWDLSVAGGPTLLHTTFANHPGQRQAYPGTHPGGDNPPRTGAVENNTLGYLYSGQPHDSVYLLSFTFAHSGSSLVLNFSGSGLEGLDNESWGLDNVVVRVR